MELATLPFTLFDWWKSVGISFTAAVYKSLTLAWWWVKEPCGHLNTINRQYYNSLLYKFSFVNSMHSHQLHNHLFLNYSFNPSFEFIRHKAYTKRIMDSLTILCYEHLLVPLQSQCTVFEPTINFSDLPVNGNGPFFIAFKKVHLRTSHLVALWMLSRIPMSDPYTV